MAKLSDGEITEIVQRQLPGYKVVGRNPTRSEKTDARGGRMKKADAISPSLAELRRKYLGGRAPLVPEAEAQDVFVGDAAEVDDEIVTVENENALDSVLQHGRKRVVISGEQRRILGMQG